MRVLAIDYGDARTGIAVSDALGMIVGQTTVIHSRSPKKTAEGIATLVRQTGAERLVMGFPKNMDGPWCSGMNGAPPWRPTASSPTAITTARSGKTPWTP